MAVIERDVVLRGKTPDGEKTIDMPITALKNVEDTADIKEKPSEGDYIPIIDTADKGQMKKTPFSVMIGPQGPKGDKGDTGSNGKDGVSVTHEWNGTTLKVTSASGTSSANLKGDKGDKGDTGDAGPKGDKGDTGPTGPAGDVHIFQGTIKSGSTAITKSSDAEMSRLHIVNIGPEACIVRVRCATTPNSSAITEYYTQFGKGVAAQSDNPNAFGLDPTGVELYSYGGIFTFEYARSSNTIIYSDNISVSSYKQGSGGLTLKVDGGVGYLAVDVTGLCLTENTIITMSDWTTKRISDLNVGDEILSVDGAGRYIPNKIIDIDSGKGDVYDQWIFSDGTVIETCNDHVIYNVDTKKFKYVSMWKIGDKAYRKDNCNVTFVEHRTINSEIKHYNIICEKPTNYFANELLAGDILASSIRYTIEGGATE